MAKTKILHIQGNEITIGFPVGEVYADLLDGAFDTLQNDDIPYMHLLLEDYLKAVDHITDKTLGSKRYR